MSVLVIGKFHGDTAVFRETIATRTEELEKMAGMAQAAGALHHRFGVGDGVVFLVDEWESVEQFQQFFGQPDVQAFVASAGADMTVPPEINVTEAVASADQF
jgi:quinol monooxygenase YgiN